FMAWDHGDLQHADLVPRGVFHSQVFHVHPGLGYSLQRGNQCTGCIIHQDRDQGKALRWSTMFPWAACLAAIALLHELCHVETGTGSSGFAEGTDQTI